jgi:hypothetical protein
LPLQFVNLVALMAAWVYIFDTIQKEREALEMDERDVYAEAEAGQRPGEVSAHCMKCCDGFADLIKHWDSTPSLVVLIWPATPPRLVSDAKPLWPQLHSAMAVTSYS